MTTNSPNRDVQARKQKRIGHSKLAEEIVHNLVSTDSCDEEVTEKLILWVLNRLNKEFPTPPAQILRPVELPDGFAPSVIRHGLQSTRHKAIMTGNGDWIHKDQAIEAIRVAGYEVK